MIAKTKTVYYCGFCRKHGLLRNAMELHERHCTLNPDRTCRWNTAEPHSDPDLRALVAELLSRAPLDKDAVNWLRDEVEGCPACMLAALRQTGIEYHYDTEQSGIIFDYMAEVERARTEEREAAAGDQW